MKTTPASSTRVAGISAAAIMATSLAAQAGTNEDRISGTAFASLNALDFTKTARPDAALPWYGQASRDQTGYRFSTSGAGNGAIDVWGGIGARALRRVNDGGSYNIAVGAGYNFGAGSAGLFYERSDTLIQYTTTFVSTEYDTVGAYFDYGLGNGIGFSGSAYTTVSGEAATNAGVFTGTTSRTGVDLEVNRLYEFGTIVAQPFGRFSYIQDELPLTATTTNQIETTRAQLGMRLFYQTDNNTAPYALVAAGFNSVSDSIGTSVDHTAPTVGFGVQTSGSLGDFHLQVDYTETFDGHHSTGLGAGLNIDF